LKKLLSRLFAHHSNDTDGIVSKRRYFLAITPILFFPLIFITFVLSDGGGAGFALSALVTLIILILAVIQLGTAALQRIQNILRNALT